VPLVAARHQQHQQRPRLTQFAGLNFVANWTPNLLVIFGATPDQALLLSIAVAGPMVLVTFASE
jgi:hypothetical protein